MSIMAFRWVVAATVAAISLTEMETAAQPSLLWRTNYPGYGGTPFCGVDALGNIYAASGNTNTVILKYSPTGILLWTFRYPGPGSFQSAALDPEGNLYAAGLATSTQGLQNFVLKLEADGIPAWTNIIAGSSISSAIALGLDGAGNLHAGKSAYNNSNKDILLLTFNSSGAIIAQAYFDGPQHGPDTLLAMAVDPKTGAAYTSLSLANTNNEPVYVFAKFDAKGSLEWIRDAGIEDNSSSPQQRLVLISQDAGIYFTDASQGRPIVWKFDSAGTLVWKAVYYGAAFPYADPYSAVVDVFGNVTGAMGDLVVHFGRMGVQRWSTRIPNARSTLLVVAFDNVFARSRHRDGSLLLTRFEPDGSQRWSQASAGTDSYPGALLATNGFCIAADTGTGPAGTRDLFLAKYTTNAGAYGPKILSVSTAKAGALGDTVELSVTAQGTGAVSYQWFQNNAILTNATNASMTFLLSSNTAGVYSVSLTDVAGTTISAAIRVLAVFPLSDQWAVLNGTAIFTLRIAGDGVPEEIQWQFDGNNLPGQTGPQLKLKNVTLAAAGIYTAQFRSGTNVISKAARLFVTDQVAMDWQKTNEASGSFVKGEAVEMTRDNLGHLAILHVRRLAYDLCIFDTNGVSLNCFNSGFTTDFYGYAFDFTADPSGRLYIASLGVGSGNDIFVKQFSPLATNLNWTQTVSVHKWDDLRSILVDGSFLYVLAHGETGMSDPAANALAITRLGGTSATNVSRVTLFYADQPSYQPTIDGYNMAFVSTNDLVFGWYHGPTNLLTRLSREGVIRWTLETPFLAYVLAVDSQDNIFIAGNGVAKYSPAGDLLWVRREGRWPTLDQSDNLYQEMGFHTAKFDSNGQRLWDAPITGTIQFDAHDSVYLSSRLSKSDGTTDLSISKLAPNGVMLWQAIYNGEQDTNENYFASFEVGEDGAVYLCTAESHVYLVKLVQRDSVGAPSIVPSPPVQFIEPGASAALSATVTGSGLAYQWLLDGMPIPGATNQTITLTNFQPSHAGGYSLRVQNRFGWVIGTETFVTSPLTLVGVAYDLPSNQRSFSFIADARFAYDVQSSTDLASWTSETNFFGTNGLVGFSATNHVTPTFYRVQKNR